MKTIPRTFEGIYAMEREAYKLHRGMTRTDQWTAIQSAWQNADDTMIDSGYKDWTNDAVLSEAWVGFFFASLISILSEPESYELTKLHVKWFENRGIIA